MISESSVPVKRNVIKRAALSTARIVGVLAVLIGVVLLLASWKSASPNAGNLMSSVGGGLVSSGLLSLLLETITRDTDWLAREILGDELKLEIKDLFNVSLAAMNSSLTELFKSNSAEMFSRETALKGIHTVSTVWFGQDGPDFVRSDEELMVLLKDGYTLMSTRRAELKARFSNTRLKTRLLFLHPDCRFMDAVANMDPRKAGAPNRQRSDCLFAISTIQQLRAEIWNEYGVEIRDRVQAYGYYLVPTWSGFLGLAKASVSMFYTRPHRGDLITFAIERTDSRGNQTHLFSEFNRDFEEIWRTARDESPSLFDYDLNL